MPKHGGKHLTIVAIDAKDIAVQTAVTRLPRSPVIKGTVDAAPVGGDKYGFVVVRHEIGISHIARESFRCVFALGAFCRLVNALDVSRSQKRAVVNQDMLDVMVVQIRVWNPVQAAVGGAEDVLVGGEKHRVVISDEAFCVARCKSVVAKLPVEASVAAHHNATACCGIIQAVGAENTPDVAPLWSVHGLPLCLRHIEKSEGNEK